MAGRRQGPAGPAPDPAAGTLTRGWVGALAALVALRLAIPLAALAAEGRALPGLPRYDYRPLNGDAFDYYATARQLISTLAREAPLTAALGVAVVLVAAGALRLRRRHPGLVWAALSATALAVGGALAVLIATMPPSGAGAVGWPLVWALPMLPLRAAGVLDPDSAFAAGLALSLAANAVTVVATAYLGRRAVGRPEAGLAAAALFASWPLLSGALAGERGWENGTWQVDVGLHLYSEPLSTALATTAAALLLARPSPTIVAGAGVLLGLATSVRLSNGILAAVAVAFVAARQGPRAAVPLVAGGLAAVPVVAAYWPIGYAPRMGDPAGFPEDPFAVDYAVRSWADSLLFSPEVLLALAPLALLGALTLRRRPALGLVGGLLIANAAFYTFYGPTWEHPRFLFVTLPELFVLEAAGVLALASLAPVPRPVRSS